MNDILYNDDPNYKDLIPQYSIHNDENIAGFFGDYYWLSNFYQTHFQGRFCPAHIIDLSAFENFSHPYYDNVEAAYQVSKSSLWLDKVANKKSLSELCEKFSNYKPEEAKKQGRLLDLRKDWDDVKLDIMELCIQAKFDWQRNPYLCMKLIKTGNKKLVELNWWGDEYWGCSFDLEKDNHPAYHYLKGQNKLGELLMERREQLREDIPDRQLRKLQTEAILKILGYI